MSLYVLECEKCGKGIEQLTRTLDEERLSECPDCKGTLNQKLYPSALFWGKGWGSAPFCFRRKFAYPHSDAKMP